MDSLSRFMMLVHTIAILVAFACCVPACAQETTIPSRSAITTTVRILGKDLLRKPAIDEQFCQRWLEEYLDTLDPSKQYFLADDISEFQTYVSKLPEMAANGETEFLTLVTERYQIRVRSALDHVLRRIDGEFDFSIDEQITAEYDNWPINNDERFERWRLQLKFDLLIERSNPSETKDAIAFLKSRFESIRKQAGEIDTEKAVGLYVDSLCRTADPHSGYLTQREFLFYLNGKLKAYSIGLTFTTCGGRTRIKGIDSELRREQMADMLDCELLAIRSQDGAIYNVREIHPSTIRQLIAFGLKNEESVTLELYDATRLKRFSVKWPRK